jgi:hypothetical protein
VDGGLARLAFEGLSMSSDRTLYCSVRCMVESVGDGLLYNYQWEIENGLLGDERITKTSSICSSHWFIVSVDDGVVGSLLST